MKAGVIAVAAASMCLMAGCGSQPPPQAASPVASTSSAPSTTTRPVAPTTSTAPAASGPAQSLGAALAQKIVFYAVGKAAGIDRADKLDALAAGVCSRLDAEQATTVGPWLNQTYGVRGDTAARVAIAAIKFRCPQHAAEVGAG